MADFVSWGMAKTILFFVFAFMLLQYIVPLLWAAIFHGVQDLKKKYKAEWALVSGGSSGIGKALAIKCAEQGLNVVIVALDDQLLKDTLHELAEDFPECEFRAVGIDMSRHSSPEYDYVERVASATADINVQVVFCNAGYLLMGAFTKLGRESQVKNIECNVLSHVKLSHVFVDRMRSAGLRGCIVFTSSMTAYFPAPGNIIYAAGKSFIEHFGLCLAMETMAYGIDVTVVLPGYTRTRLYDNGPKLSALNFFEKMASTPEDIANVMFRSVGRFVIRDQSFFSHLIRIVMKIIDPNLLAYIIGKSLPYTADYKNHEIMR